jgi:hypothetical protein
MDQRVSLLGSVFAQVVPCALVSVIHAKYMHSALQTFVHEYLGLPGFSWALVEKQRDWQL